MRDLSPYEQAFDRAYPDYATDQYEAIRALTERLSAPHRLQEIESNEFQGFCALLGPLISIKNYKSQVPFPVDVKGVLKCAIEIKQCRLTTTPLSDNAERIFLTIIEKEGFQLPTVSALFHFCHSDSFPIVDRNVEAACEILKDAHESEFTNFSAPKLPAATTSAHNKLSKYRSFITFVDRLRLLQREQHGGAPDYRFIDKALMVLGVEGLRRQVEEVSKRGAPKTARP